jgi:eukaryotic-like serine/threonine-protein kinase
MTLALEVRLEMSALPLEIQETEPPVLLPHDLVPGTVLQGTYRILRPLAEGGCGQVYAAAHTRLPGQFAVKVLHRSLARNPDALARFRQEAEITSTLRHPHIVQVLDFNVSEQGFPYLVMELLEGRPLAARVADAGALTPADAVRIVEQIAQALNAAHVRGIVHRDLKPDNVMLLDAEGMTDFVKVLDFGISQASWQPRLTDSMQVAGTPQYMAPEQACGLRDQIGPWTDQFSLAAIAYTLLTGHEPFSADDQIAVMYQVVHADPALPSHFVPLGPAVDAVIMRGLSKQPANRFPDVTAFAEALRAAFMTGAPAPEVDFELPIHEEEPMPSLPFDAPRVLPPDPPPVGPPGRQTVRLIRKVRRRIHRTPSRLALLALAAAGAVMYFSPAARTHGVDVWHAAQSHAEQLIAHAR